MVSWDLSRLRTSRAIMLCGKELAVNACWERKFAFLCLQTTASQYYAPINKNTEYISIIRVIHNSYFLYSSKKSAKLVSFFISKGIPDQISVALCFIILAPEFERAFGKANCRSLSERLLLVKKFSQTYVFVRYSNKLHHFAPPPKISIGCGPAHSYSQLDWNVFFITSNLLTTEFQIRGKVLVWLPMKRMSR